jgi:hypothetical protein
VAERIGYVRHLRTMTADLRAKLIKLQADKLELENDYACWRYATIPTALASRQKSRARTRWMAANVTVAQDPPATSAGQGQEHRAHRRRCRHHHRYRPRHRRPGGAAPEYSMFFV